MILDEPLPSKERIDAVLGIRINIEAIQQDLSAVIAASNDRGFHLQVEGLANVLKQIDAVLKVAVPFSIEKAIDGVQLKTHAVPLVAATQIDLGEVASIIETIVPQIADRDALTDATELLLMWGLDALAVAVDDPRFPNYRPQLGDLANNFRRLALAENVRALEAANERAQAVVRDVEQAAGTVATTNLAEHFQDASNSDGRTADVLRILAIAVLVGAAAAGGLLVDLPEHPSVADVLRHYAFIVPALVVAAYLAREGTSHRASSRWAAGLAVQLRTLRAFTDQMPEEARDDVRLTFGRRLFLEANPTGHTSGGKSSSMGEVDQLLQKLVELGLGRPGGGSKPPAASP